jgi:archaeal type IV pilus assembly protein PilA
MKANQAFKHNDEAVSPVIGVILMVAITVVLAAVVFVLVTRLANNQKEDAPDITFSKTEAPDGKGATFQVVAVGPDAGTWAGYTLLVNGATAGANDCVASTVASDADGTIWLSPAPTDPIRAGQTIDCDVLNAATDPADGVVIQLRHEASNTLITVGTV